VAASLTLSPTLGAPGTVFAISGDNLATAPVYGLYWDSSSTFISTALTNDMGHFEGITYTVPLTATIGNIYTVTAELAANVVAAAPFQVVEPNQEERNERGNGEDMKTAELLKQLTEARGPSGYEAEIRKIVRERFGQYADETRTDALGNVIALKRGVGPEPRPTVMLAGHMDEIALMVKQIEKGFLHIVEIGGFDPRVLLGQEVVVHGRRELPGVVVSVPPHFTDPAERDKAVPLDKLFVDVGLPPGQVDKLVRVGDLITIHRRFTELNSGRATSKAMDDRTAVAAIAICLEELGRLKHQWDVYAVATVQEEETLGGAFTSSYGLAPTIAIAIDVSFGHQPGLSEAETIKMDKGPSITLGPNIHPKVFDGLVAAAKAMELPHQIEPIPGHSGTDAWAIQVSRAGVPTGLLGIPLRYMHTSVETVVLKDVERTGRLLAAFIARLDDEFLDVLTWKKENGREEA